MKAWPVFGIAIVQIILLIAHWFLFHTIVQFSDAPSAATILALRLLLLALAFSFVVAALLSFRSANALVVVIYKLASLWLGFLNFSFTAACLCWLVWFAWFASHLSANPASARPWIAIVLFSAAILAAVYGLLNALVIRTRRVSVTLPGLPATWLGRRAVVMSDLHLGNIHRVKFSRRMVAMANALQPDVVFIPGDLFDGTEADLDHLVAPFKQLTPPFGVYFTTGNHEEFEGTHKKLVAISGAGIHVLHHRKVVLDGLQVAGIPWSDSTSPIRMRASLEKLHLDRTQASILLNHMPGRLPLVEQAGISLQLSGHTHGGQVFPFTVATRRVFGKFTSGLHRFGSLLVYTSTGAGTWGPPMRLGTHSEIVLIEFQ